ncbi:MAG: MFS transporter [Chloroflexi bacterium]|nr:MFS transporter [Chloroflexota bacterium]
MAILTRVAGSPVGALLPLFIFVHFSHHLNTGILAPLLPLIRDAFQLSYFQAGLLVSAFTLTYGASQVPLGPVADRFGGRIVVTIGLLGVGLATFLIGLTGEFGQFLILLILMGLFGGSYHAPMAALIAGYCPPAVRGRVLGMHTIGGSAGFLVTPVLAGLIASAAGWRGAYITLAIPTILSGLAFWQLTRQRSATVSAADKKQVEKVEVRLLLRALGGVVLLVSAFTIIGSSVSAFLSLYLVDRFRLDVPVAATTVGLMFGAGIVGAPLGGTLSDRFGRKPVIVASLAATGPLLFLMTRLDWGIPLVVIVVLVGGIMTMRMPVMESFVMDTVPAHRRSSLMGIYYFFNQEIGGIAAPMLGLMIDRFGMHPAFTGLGIAACLVSAMALLVRKRL